MLNMAVLYEERGKCAEAEACVQDVLAELPNHDRARQVLKSVKSSATMVYDEQSQGDRDRRSAILDMPLSDFELSVRSRNCLRQMNLRTLGDLLRTTEAELLSYKNFGETSLSEIKSLLSARGLRLGQSLVPAELPALRPSVSPAADVPPHLNRSVAELELSVRSRKALQRLGVTTIAELSQRSEAELLAIKNFGETSLTEIKRELAKFSLTLRSH
jgi:DNA-directed RNA polymerase subunit alpha